MSDRPPLTPRGLLDELTSAFVGPESGKRAAELAEREHELAVAAVTGEAVELTEQAVHRAAIREAAEREAIARARQQEILTVALAIMTGLGIVVLAMVGLLVASLVMGS